MGLEAALARALQTAERVDALEREVAELRARLGMNSRNSSKPPASDPPGTPRRDAPRTGRALGGRMERLTTELLGAEDRRARGLGQDFARHAGALWNFAEREGVEPTNNTAERGLRKRGLWRKTRFGSDSAGGVRFVERILSVVETCRQQRRSAFDYLRDAILAHRCAAPPPLLFS